MPMWSPGSVICSFFYLGFPGVALSGVHPFGVSLVFFAKFCYDGLAVLHTYPVTDISDMVVFFGTVMVFFIVDIVDGTQ